MKHFFRIITIAVFILPALRTTAQKTAISGMVVDSSRRSGLAYATVSLVRANDSTLVTFAHADSAGRFSMRATDQGSYLLSASYVGYVTVWQPIRLDGMSPTTRAIIFMHDVKTADEVTINQKRAPVVINNDTLEFNTENFKTQPNAVVEEMLKKMPGITIDKDGTVKVNGQTIKRVLVNGKEFFTGDVKTATQNLPADAVDKVQVFDKQSDQAKFTGIDDASREKTINLKLKKDRNHALFGKLMASVGDQGKFDAQVNMNKFNGNEQLSFIGMSNNTNRQGFQVTDVLNFTGELSKGMRSGGGIVIKTDANNDNNGLPITGLGQTQQGVATTTAGGINYNNNWNKEKTDWSSNYLGSDIHLLTDKVINTQNIIPGNSFNRSELSHTVNDNTQHRLNVILDQKLDSSLSFKMSPSVTWQSTGKQSTDQYAEFTSDSTKLNDGSSMLHSDADAFNFSNTILLRKRFRKKGRTVSLNVNMGYNHSQMTGSLLSDNRFYANGVNPVDTSIDQTYTRNATAGNLGGTLVYTEPIGKKSLFELSSFFNNSSGSSNKKTYDYDRVSGRHDAYNTLLSNDYKTSYNYSGGGVHFRTNQKNLNITAGLQLQQAGLRGMDHSFNQTITQRFTDILPDAIVQYNISRMKNLKLEYNTATIQPGITQLQPVADLSDPLNISIGNPLLKRSWQQNIMLSLFAANPAERKSLFGFVNFSTSANAIVQSDTIKQNGARTTTFTNTSGVYNFMGIVEYGFPLRKLHSHVEIGTSFSLNSNVAFVNAERNTIHALSVGPKIGYHFTIDDHVDLDLTARVAVNHTTYTIQQFSDNNYFQQNYGIDLTNYIFWKLVLHNEFNYILNTGRADGFNTRVPLWNASLSKGFFRNKRAEARFVIQDILNKNTGITRSSNQGYIVDEKYNVLRRYFLLAFTYSLNKSGLNSGPRAMIKTF